VWALFAGDYLKGEFTPKNPNKCLNKNGKLPNSKDKITFRSSYEMIFANWCDLEDDVIEWGSEVIEIQYFSKVDNKKHRYITDFVFMSRNADGGVDKWLVEIKPKSQVPVLNAVGEIQFPELPKKKRVTKKSIERWQSFCNVLKTNHEKWESARVWARKNGYNFKVITEQELGLVVG